MIERICYTSIEKNIHDLTIFNIMKSILINYAQNIWYNAQKLNSSTGIKYGGFSHVYQHSLDDIDPGYVEEHQHILSQQRGAGYWLWKPYIIYKNLIELRDDDVLLYCDSGARFEKSFDNYMFDLCRDDEKGMILFKDTHMQRTYTKRDCFVYMDCDQPEYHDNSQLIASYQLMRKTDFTMSFYAELLQWSEDERILTDIPNTSGHDNLPEFIDHRHEQSILTNMQQRDNITTVVDPSQWGDSRREPGHERLIYHHRLNYAEDEPEYIQLINESKS